MPSINLCLASQLFHPFYAGGALRFQRYLPGLKARGINTHVFTATPSRDRLKAFGLDVTWPHNQTGQLLPTEHVDGAPVHRVRLPDAGSRRRVIEYGRALIQFCQQPENRPDVIQALPLPMWSVPALIKLRRQKMPLAYAYNLLPNPTTNARARIFHRYARRFQFHLADKIIVNSRVMEPQLRRLGVKTPITVIANGVDTNRFRPSASAAERNEMRRPLGIAHEAPVIISVGAVEPRKGIDLLLAAWARLAPKYPHARLIIVGPRPDLADPTLAGFHQELEDLLTASGARERVHFAGRVDNVPAYLRTADLFVFTSRREGLPNVVLEAMASGLPVIMTKFMGLSDELGRRDEQYLLTDRQPDALCQRIELILTNKPFATQLGLSARNWIETRLNVESVLDQYAALYRELANRSQTGQ